ncbi:TNF receptor-associated factor 3-like [Hydra vulgaris]|uniref:TNF receptor-associated factor 3-like n=1 Tax=Hydra vulgaris TaxID=6087 RepID=A0ABM4B2S2_HYDVU
MSTILFPCCFCEVEFTMEDLMNHQLLCSTEQYDHECFNCKKKVKDLLNHECDNEFIEVLHKICSFCNTAVNNKDYYEHSVICFNDYKEQQKIYIERIVQDENKNLNYLNLTINHIMKGLKTQQEILIKHVVESKTKSNKETEQEQDIKKLQEENIKLYEIIEKTNKEMTDLNSLVYDNMLILANQDGFQKLNNEITKLNQIVEENSAEFLKLKKMFESSKKNNVTQHTFKDIQIIKLDQMILRLLSDEPYYSEPIYTPEGYHYRMKILTRSTNENNVAIYFQILRGEVDEALKWPFNKKIICSLRNKEKYFAHTIANDNYKQT